MFWIFPLFCNNGNFAFVMHRDLCNKCLITSDFIFNLVAVIVIMAQFRFPNVNLWIEIMLFFKPNRNSSSEIISGSFMRFSFRILRKNFNSSILSTFVKFDSIFERDSYAALQRWVTCMFISVLFHDSVVSPYKNHNSLVPTGFQIRAVGNLSFKKTSMEPKDFFEVKLNTALDCAIRDIKFSLRYRHRAAFVFNERATGVNKQLRWLSVCISNICHWNKAKTSYETFVAAIDRIMFSFNFFSFKNHTRGKATHQLIDRWCDMEFKMLDTRLFYFFSSLSIKTSKD